MEEENKLAFLLIEPNGKEYLIDDKFIYDSTKYKNINLYKFFMKFEGFRKFKNKISNGYLNLFRISGYTLNEFIDFIDKIIISKYADIELIRGILKFNIIDNNYFELILNGKIYYLRVKYNIEYIDELLNIIYNKHLDWDGNTDLNKLVTIIIDRDPNNDVPYLLYQLTKLNLLYIDDINRDYN